MTGPSSPPESAVEWIGCMDFEESSPEVAFAEYHQEEGTRARRTRGKNSKSITPIAARAIEVLVATGGTQQEKL